LRGSFGTGIRPPDAFEIAFTDNSGLKPERSKSGEFGVTQTFAGSAVQLDATAFFNSYTDLIISVGSSYAGSSRYRTDNISNAQASGAEFGAAWRANTGLGRPRELHVPRQRDPRGQRIVERANPVRRRRPLLRRPRHSGSVDASLTRGPSSAFAELQMRGETLDAEPAFGPGGGLYTNEGYTVFNLGGSWRPLKPLEIFARALNLFDRQYEEVLGYPAPGARVTLVSALLWADNVSFRYAAGAPLVVDGVTVRLDDGALAGILGPNGSGKTTLLRLLSGTRRPTSGRVLVRDRPLGQLSRREAARQIAVVPQETELAFEYRAIEIVLMGRHPPPRRLHRRGAR
jgi:ABC-type multidrug transport system fused ATPase/permease subunit